MGWWGIGPCCMGMEQLLLPPSADICMVMSSGYFADLFCALVLELM